MKLYEVLENNKEECLYVKIKDNTYLLTYFQARNCYGAYNVKSISTKGYAKVYEIERAK